MSKVWLVATQRQQVKNFELQQKWLKAFMCQCTLPLVVRRKLCWQYARVSAYYACVFLKDRCVFSGRARAVSRFFHVSRLMVLWLFKGTALPY